MFGGRRRRPPYDARAMVEAAFFDLDKTIVSRSSSLALSRPLYRAGMVSRGQLVKGAYAQLVYLMLGADERKMERLRDGMLQLTKGWDRAQVERLVQDALLERYGRWPLCPVCDDGDPHALDVEPELGPDPQWVCHKAGVRVAALGSLGGAVSS